MALCDKVIKHVSPCKGNMAPYVIEHVNLCMACMVQVLLPRAATTFWKFRKLYNGLCAVGTCMYHPYASFMNHI